MYFSSTLLSFLRFSSFLLPSLSLKKADLKKILPQIISTKSLKDQKDETLIKL